MAFDQNSIPKDLRPLNSFGVVAEEACIAPLTSSVRPIYAAAATPLDCSVGTVPTVYYPILDAGLSGVGYSNGMPTHGETGWVTQPMPPGQPQLCVVSSGLVNPMPSLGVPSNALDQACDEGGDGLASGRKVKFLCSFGGEILPRPNDGELRYVGGHTKIVSVRRDLSFNDLGRTMVNISGENVEIKYQLPEEDLNALVSVSCPDDLEHMMEEYEKLYDSSSDGSAKFRVFLFSTPKVDSSELIHFSVQRGYNQKYLEEVKGISEGLGVGDTTRKESTGISEFSGGDAIGSRGQGPGEVNRRPTIGGLSPKECSVHSQESTPKTAGLDQSRNIGSSNGALGISVMSGPPPTMPIHMDHDVDRSVSEIVPHNHSTEMQPPGVTLPVSSTYMQAHGDTPLETVNRTDYVHYPSHLGYPAHIMRDVAPVMQQQKLAPSVSPRQFIPTVQVTMPPSSHTSVNPNMFPVLIQQQQFQRVDNTSRQQGVLQIPVAYNPYQAQVSPQVFGGGYGWQQVPHQEQAAFSEGWMQNQQGAVSDVSGFEDYNLYQKVLPHSHSDTIAQDQKQSPANNMSDLKIGHYSLQLDGKGKPEEKTVTIGDHGEMTVGQQGTAAQLPQLGKTQVEMMRAAKKLEGNFINNGYAPQTEDSSAQPIPQAVLGQTVGLQSQIGMVAAAIPKTYQDNAVLPVGGPIQYQIRQEPVFSRPTSGDHPIIAATSSPLSVNHLYESPKRPYSNISFMVPNVENQESFGAYDHQKLMDRGMENLQLHPAEIIPNNLQRKLPVDSLKREDVQLNRVPKGAEGETFWNTNFQDHHTVLGGNKLNRNEIPPVSARESPYSHNPTESHEVAQSPFITNPHMHSHGLPGSYALHEESNPASSQPQLYVIGDVEHSSNSLFSHQNPWNFQQDTQFPPPMPKLIHLEKEASDTRIPAGVMRQMDVNGFPESNGAEVITEWWLEDGSNQVSGSSNVDVNSESAQSNKVSGSAEEFIKQELQAVAEGVAASVFQTPAESQENTDMQEENEDYFEKVEATWSEKMSTRSSLSEGIGRLQVIENADLEELQELGSGAFGTVYHGKWRGTDVAIKRLNDRCFAGKPLEKRDDFLNEAIKLADMHHPNVVALYGVALDGPGGSVATVTEYMVNGSLRTALQKEGRNLDKRKQLFIAMDIAFGMEYLHGKNLVHFDLKSDNLLVNLRDPHRPICKVADLGLSKVKRQTLISGGLQGTLPWMAPELFDGSNSRVSEKVDVYAFGIVMWELLTGEEPYADLPYGVLIGGIASNTLRPPIPEPCDIDWRSLMERCWSPEPPQRPSFTEISNHLQTMASKFQQRDKGSKLKNDDAVS